MQMPDHNHDEEALGAPAKLLSALKQSSKASLFVPPTVDEAILHAARRHLSPQQKPGFKWLLFIRWGFAVAALAFLLAIAPKLLRRTGSTARPEFAREDLNHDGQVDVLDAFALARELKSKAHPDQQLDVNGDGVVDERDVASLVARAVSLGKGGRS
jgi:hypothetical protein